MKNPVLSEIIKNNPNAKEDYRRWLYDSLTQQVIDQLESECRSYKTQPSNPEPTSVGVALGFAQGTQWVIDRMQELDIPQQVSDINDPEYTTPPTQ